MKTGVACIPCLVRQATNTLAKLVPEGPAREAGIRRILEETARLDYALPTRFQAALCRRRCAK